MTKEGSTNCIFKDPPPNRGFCARALKGGGGGQESRVKIIRNFVSIYSTLFAIL